MRKFPKITLQINLLIYVYVQPSNLTHSNFNMKIIYNSKKSKKEKQNVLTLCIKSLLP